MRRFEAGDRMCVDIPDEMDPDYDRLHGSKGTVVEVVEDDAGQETGYSRNSYIFFVESDEGEVKHLRWRDLRPSTKQYYGYIPYFLGSSNGNNALNPCILR